MKVKLYSVKDVQLNMFHQPMFLNSEVLAVRSLYMAMDNEQSLLQTFAENYFLFEIAEFDDETGKITSLPEPRLVISASTLKERISFDKQKGKTNEHTN